MQAWQQLGVTAVAAYNDDVAAAVTGAALSAGLRVPADVAVIGHDDTPRAALFSPALSSIRMHPAGMGRFVAELALHETAGTPPPTIAPEINVSVIRRTST